MFLRACRQNDKRYLQQLYFEVVHAIGFPDFTSDDLDRWAPLVPDRAAWNRLDEQYCFVVEFHKKVVGFVGLNTDGKLEWLYVHPIHQGKGIAKALLRHIERQVRKQNRQSLKACVTPNAVDFFHHFGYRAGATKPEHGQYPIPRICMEKQLEQEIGRQSP